MIITVTLNAALDITYDVAELVPHASHRVTAVRQRAGGKGVNVASVLARMGRAVIATGYAGGRTGADICADLAARGIAHRFVDGGGDARRTVTVVSQLHGDATLFNEPGPLVPAAAWTSLLDTLGELVRDHRAAVVVVSGSLPRGLPADACSQLVAAARAYGARVVVDADGAALRDAVTAGPDVVKPNRAELLAATGCADIAAGVGVLRSSGARDVVVSDGADGLLVFPRGERAFRARLSEPLTGNPTGAGDALVAALAAGLEAADRWPTTAPRAVAWSAAAVRQPVAGEIDPDDVTNLEAQVQMEEMR